jgi:hypothetical protein
MKRLFLLATLAALICGAFAAGFIWRDPELEAALRQASNASTAAGKVRETLEASVADLTRERDEAREQREKLEGQVRDLSQKLAESETAASKNAAALAKATAQVNAQPAPGSGNNPMKSMAEMFKTPEMRDAMVQQNLAQLDVMYGKLYGRLQLEGADKQDFKNLLGERMRAELEMSLKMMGGNLSVEQSAAAAAELKKANEASDQKIRAFLNNENDYQTFQRWEQTKPERMMLNMGANAFAGAGEPLTPAQEDQLVSAMFAARTQASAVPDMSKPENFTASNLGPQMTEKVLARYDEQAAQVAGGAAAYLSEKQLEALKAFQKQQRAMQEMGMKMGAAMINGK